MAYQVHVFFSTCKLRLVMMQQLIIRWLQCSVLASFPGSPHAQMKNWVGPGNEANTVHGQDVSLRVLNPKYVTALT